MAKKVPERFVPLAVDAYLQLGGIPPMAELLYYRMLQWAKANPESEGVVPEFIIRQQLSRGLKPAVQLAKLEESQKIIAKPEGWFIRVWFSFNPTKDEVTEREAGRRKGAQIANHKQGRHTKPVRSCPLCTRSQRRSSDAASDAPASRSSVAEQRAFSSLRELRPSDYDAAQEGRAPSHGSRHLTIGELNRADRQTQITHGWPLDPANPHYGGWSPGGWTQPQTDPRNEPDWRPHQPSQLDPTGGDPA